MEEKDKIIVKWAQEDVETSKNLLNIYILRCTALWTSKSNAPSEVWITDLRDGLPKRETACSGKAISTRVSALWTESWTQCMTHDNSQNILIEAKSSTVHASAIQIARWSVIIVIKSRTKAGKKVCDSESVVGIIEWFTMQFINHLSALWLLVNTKLKIRVQLT